MGLDPEADAPERAWALLANGHFLTSPGMFRALHSLRVCQTPTAGHHTPLWAARSWAVRWVLPITERCPKPEEHSIVLLRMWKQQQQSDFE